MRSALFTRLRKKTRKTRWAKVTDRLLTVVALLIVWSLTGLWHGARTNFVLWGLYYGLLIALSTLFAPLFDRYPGKSTLRRVWNVGKTFVLVLVGYVLFRADSLRQILDFFSSLTKPATAAFPLDAADLCVAGVGLALLVIADTLHAKELVLRDRIARWVLPLRWLLWLSLLVAVVLFGIYGPGYDASSFLYFKF